LATRFGNLYNHDRAKTKKRGHSGQRGALSTRFSGLGNTTHSDSPQKSH